MLDHLIGILLLGLGLQNPAFHEFKANSVLGETAAVTPPPGNNTQGNSNDDRKEVKQDTKEIRDDRKGFWSDVKQGKPMQAIKDRMELSKDKKERREDLNDLRKERHASGEGEREEEREALLKAREEAHEKFKKEIEATREEAKKQFEQQKEAFKKRLETIKDEKKKGIVSRVDARMSEINTKRTEAMTNHLNKMDEILVKLNSRVTELKSKGVDTTSVESAIAQAQSAITAAKASVKTQAGKEYVIGVTTENNLKNDVGRAMSALENDLKTTYQTVVQARLAVEAAIKAFAPLYGQLKTTPTVKPTIGAGI